MVIISAEEFLKHHSPSLHLNKPKVIISRFRFFTVPYYVDTHSVHYPLFKKQYINLAIKRALELIEVHEQGENEEE